MSSLKKNTMFTHLRPRCTPSLTARSLEIFLDPPLPLQDDAVCAPPYFTLLNDDFRGSLHYCLSLFFWHKEASVFSSLFFLSPLFRNISLTVSEDMLALAEPFPFFFFSFFFFKYSIPFFALPFHPSFLPLSFFSSFFPP